MPDNMSVADWTLYSIESVPAKALLSSQYSRHVLIFLVGVPTLRSTTLAKIAGRSRRVTFDLTQAADLTRFLAACRSFGRSFVCAQPCVGEGTLSRLFLIGVHRWKVVVRSHLSRQADRRPKCGKKRKSIRREAFKGMSDWMGRSKRHGCLTSAKVPLRFHALLHVIEISLWHHNGRLGRLESSVEHPARCYWTSIMSFWSIVPTSNRRRSHVEGRACACDASARQAGVDDMQVNADMKMKSAHLSCYTCLPC